MRVLSFGASATSVGGKKLPPRSATRRPPRRSRAPRATASAHLRLDEVEGGADRERAEGRRRVERIAHAVRSEDGAGALQELVVEARVDVDALDRAARLAGVVAGAVDDVLDREVEVGVARDVGRVLAAELEPGADQPIGGRELALHGAPGLDGAGESRRGDARIAQQRAGGGGGHDDVVTTSGHVERRERARESHAR
jgi:hypothetical protein